MELRALAAAGCPLIEIHEPAATEIGADPTERALFRDAHRRLLDGVEDPHLSLAITGGNADGAGIETLLSARYSSLALDLIAGPDNWRLVVATPGDRGRRLRRAVCRARIGRSSGAPPVGRRLRRLDRGPGCGAGRPGDVGIARRDPLGRGRQEARPAR